MLACCCALTQYITRAPCRIQREYPQVLDALTSQRELLALLDRIAQDIKGMRATAERRTERLRYLIGPGGQFEELSTLRAPLPTNPK